MSASRFQLKEKNNRSLISFKHIDYFEKLFTPRYSRYKKNVNSTTHVVSNANVFCSCSFIFYLYNFIDFARGLSHYLSGMSSVFCLHVVPIT